MFSRSSNKTTRLQGVRKPSSLDLRPKVLVHRLLSPFFPNTYPLLLLPDRLLAYGAIPYFGVRIPARPTMEVSLDQCDPASACTRVLSFLHPASDDAWYLGLPLKYFNLVKLRLPAAADADLGQAVRYALLRHVPFDLSLAKIGYARVAGTEEVEVSVALHEQLEALVSALGRGGIHPAGVFPSLAYLARAHGRDGVYVSAGTSTVEALVIQGKAMVFHAWDDVSPARSATRFLQSIRPLLDNLPAPPTRVHAWECRVSPGELASSLGMDVENVETIFPEFGRSKLERAPFRIGMDQPEQLKKRRLSRHLRLGVLALFFLALAALPLAEMLGKKAHLKRLEAAIAQIRSQGETVAQRRGEVQDTTEFLRELAREAQSQPMVLDLLLELTRVLPADAWLESFFFTQNRVRVQGRATSATAIIEAMEKSPFFKEVGFESPVTRVSNMDAFQVRAELEP